MARERIPALRGTTTLPTPALLADPMPCASRAGIAAMMRPGREPEEAARMAGAGGRRRLGADLGADPGARPHRHDPALHLGIGNLTPRTLLAVPGTDAPTTCALRPTDHQDTQAAHVAALIIAAIACAGAALGAQAPAPQPHR